MEKEKLRPIPSSDIKLGEPLPYSVYDRNGLLLLREGFVIHMQRQRDTLVSNGLFVGVDVREGARVPSSLRSQPSAQEDERATFEVIDLVKLRLQRLFDNFRATRFVEEFSARVETLASTVQEACTHDTDSALANLNLDYESPYPVVHHLQTAMVCELIGKKLGVGEDARLQLV